MSASLARTAIPPYRNPDVPASRNWKCLKTPRAHLRFGVRWANAVRMRSSEKPVIAYPPLREAHMGIRSLVSTFLLLITAGSVPALSQMNQPEMELQTGHTHAVKCLGFTADGRRLVSGGQEIIIRLWEVSTGRLLRTFAATGSGVTAVAVSPDGLRITSSAYANSQLWAHGQKTQPSPNPSVCNYRGERHDHSFWRLTARR